MGRGRKATDMLAECVVELVREYKKRIDALNLRIDYLTAECKENENHRIKAVIQADNMSDKLGEIAELIAGITEHTEGGDIRIYLSDIQPENESKLKRLFKLLDIPMTEAEIKEGVTIDED